MDRVASVREQHRRNIVELAIIVNTLHNEDTISGATFDNLKKIIEKLELDPFACLQDIWDQPVNIEVGKRKFKVELIKTAMP